MTAQHVNCDDGVAVVTAVSLIRSVQRCLLGTFFIATDPVSGCTSNHGRLIFGVGVGIITLGIRRWGGYPDGVAFAVLLMSQAGLMFGNLGASLQLTIIPSYPEIAPDCENTPHSDRLWRGSTTDCAFEAEQKSRSLNETELKRTLCKLYKLRASWPIYMNFGGSTNG